MRNWRGPVQKRYAVPIPQQKGTTETSGVNECEENLISLRTDNG